MTTSVAHVHKNIRTTSLLAGIEDAVISLKHRYHEQICDLDLAL